MADQAHFWSEAAATYEQEFIDPYLPGVRNPLPRALEELAVRKGTAADLGCGVGPLLPLLARHFGRCSPWISPRGCWSEPANGAAA